MINNLEGFLAIEKKYYDVNGRGDIFAGYEISSDPFDGVGFLTIYLGTDDSRISKECEEEVNLPMVSVKIDENKEESCCNSKWVLKDMEYPEILGEKLSSKWGEKCDNTDIGINWRRRMMEFSIGSLIEESLTEEEFFIKAREMAIIEIGKYIDIWLR